MNKEVTSWNCLEQLSDMFWPSNVLCQISNTQNTITCCNGSDYCNRGLRPRLPTEQPTTDPQTTGTVSGVEPYLLNTAVLYQGAWWYMQQFNSIFIGNIYLWYFGRAGQSTHCHAGCFSFGRWCHDSLFLQWFVVYSTMTTVCSMIDHIWIRTNQPFFHKIGKDLWLTSLFLLQLQQPSWVQIVHLPNIMWLQWPIKYICFTEGALTAESIQMTLRKQLVYFTGNTWGLMFVLPPQILVHFVDPQWAPLWIHIDIF